VKEDARWYQSVQFEGKTLWFLPPSNSEERLSEWWTEHKNFAEVHCHKNMGK